MKAWFVSDIHLKSLNERNGNILLRFLQSIKNKERAATHIFLLGDIFDLWVGDHQFYAQRFQPIVDLLIDLRNQNIEVIYFEGNHDIHVKNFWEQKAKIPCYIEDKYFKLDALTIRVGHGDLINPDDKAYERYRKVVRTEAMKFVTARIPAEKFYKFGEWWSRTSRKYSTKRRRDNEVALRKMIRIYAQKTYQERAFDVVITGHMHVRDDWTFAAQNQQIRSINLGSWFDQPQVLSITEGKIDWEMLS